MADKIHDESHRTRAVPCVAVACARCQICVLLRNVIFNNVTSSTIACTNDNLIIIIIIIYRRARNMSRCGSIKYIGRRRGARDRGVCFNSDAYFRVSILKTKRRDYGSSFSSYNIRALRAVKTNFRSRDIRIFRIYHDE